MKKALISRERRRKRDRDDDLLPEYRVDYRKAKANRFAARMSDAVVVVLEPGVAAVFKSAETVNRLWRPGISARPETRRRKAPEPQAAALVPQHGAGIKASATEE
jgi:hypothetical protein